MYKVFNIGDDGIGYRYFTGPKKVTATKGKYYQGVPSEKRLEAYENQSPIENFYDLSGSFGNCRHEGSVEFRSGKKPEKLLKLVLDYFSRPGDIVLDSFLGSGTTAAVSHKMSRRYIGIERGEHAVSHCATRLKNVVEGEQSGISEAAGWKGGGGFRFYRLGAPVFDEAGLINPDIRFHTLAAHIWFAETGRPLNHKKRSPFLGVHDGTGYYLLYNGILGDKRADGGNVLTGKVLECLPAHNGTKIIFGESCRLGVDRLKREGVVFRQIPYEIKTR